MSQLGENEEDHFRSLQTEDELRLLSVWGERQGLNHTVPHYFPITFQSLSNHLSAGRPLTVTPLPLDSL